MITTQMKPGRGLAVFVSVDIGLVHIMRTYANLYCSCSQGGISAWLCIHHFLRSVIPCWSALQRTGVSKWSLARAYGWCVIATWHDWPFTTSYGWHDFYASLAFIGNILMDWPTNLNYLLFCRVFHAPNFHKSLATCHGCRRWQGLLGQLSWNATWTTWR